MADILKGLLTHACTRNAVLLVRFICSSPPDEKKRRQEEEESKELLSCRRCKRGEEGRLRR